MAFVISDEDSTASEPELDRPVSLSTAPQPAPHGVKRPRTLATPTAGGNNDGIPAAARSATVDDVDAKVEWTDESDGAYERLKKRKRVSGRQGGKTSGGAVGRGKASGVDAAETKKTKKTAGGDRGADEEDSAIPDYLRQRRRAFDDRHTRLQEAGLLLPPDYTDIYFSDDDDDLWRRQNQRSRPAAATDVFGVDGRLGGGDTGGENIPTNAKHSHQTRQTRPQFDASVRPSRACEDIVLPYSAGVIPGSIAQYLRDYQITGVQFLHRLFVYQRGGILGDDMGLGKTVQVAAFLAAAFGKTGDERDAKRMRKMRRAGDADPENSNSRWYPRVLVVCPGSLIENWRSELQRWGWWHVDVFHGTSKADVLQAARAGRLEVMVTTYSTYKNHRDRINTVRWDAVVADECHVLKERAAETTRAMNAVNALCRIGLTGTAIQNRYEELWNLLNWTNPGRFGSLREWSATVSRPLTLGQSHDATLYQLSLARRTAKKLVQNLLPDVFLRRMKSLIAHQLPRKTDRVVFCPLTDRQARAYAHLVDSEQVRLLRSVADPCACGSGNKRGWCCHRLLSDGKTSWFSLVFPTIQSLLKLANHLTLLVPAADTMGRVEDEGEDAGVDGDGDGDVNKTAADARYDRAMKVLKICVPDDWATLWRQRDSLATLADPSFCGKWKVLRRLLRFWHANGDKVLVFSHNVRLLRILQHLFRNTSYSVSFLDGSLRYDERQRVVDAFNADPAQFVFLISTKAGGVGLNIASANKVVIFDPHWNPAYDLQAQDRAYRIGQVRDVDVFRLVSAGTIEEIVYARQIYKQQQANIGYRASTERRYFRGVQQDSERRGEIFGLSNLFAFHADQVLLRDIVNKTNIAEAKAGVHLTAIDMEQAATEADETTAVLAQLEGSGAGADAAALKQLAAVLEKDETDDTDEKTTKSPQPRSDAIQAILASAGVEYTHDNAEVVGSSRVEAQLSRQAELFLGDDADEHDADPQEEEEEDDDDDDGGGGGGNLDHGHHHHNDISLLADTSAAFVAAGDLAAVAGGGGGAHGPDGDDARTLAALPNAPPHFCLRYNPPPDVLHRQFGTMARTAGSRATDFALVVEGWTPEQRRQFLDTFYRQRSALLREQAEAGRETEGEEEEEEDEDEGVKQEVKQDIAKEEKDDQGAVLPQQPLQQGPLADVPVAGDHVAVRIKNELDDYGSHTAVRIKNEPDDDRGIVLPASSPPVRVKNEPRDEETVVQSGHYDDNDTDDMDETDETDEL